MYIYPSNFPSPSALNLADWFDPALSSSGSLYNYLCDDTQLGSNSFSDSSLTTQSSSPDSLFDACITFDNTEDSDSDRSEDIDPFSQCIGDQYTLVGNQAYLKSSL